MKEILKSVARYVELSREFTVSGDEVYEGFDETEVIRDNGYLTISSTGYIGSVSPSQKLHVCGTPSPTKLEQYTKSLQEKYKKAARYEEYIELQKTLTEYFRSINKLNKDEDTKV